MIAAAERRRGSRGTYRATAVDDVCLPRSERLLRGDDDDDMEAWMRIRGIRHLFARHGVLFLFGSVVVYIPFRLHRAYGRAVCMIDTRFLFCSMFHYLRGGAW